MSQKQHHQVLECVPVIDISSLVDQTSDNARRIITIHQIDQACREWGFFQVTNHGIPKELIQDFRDQSRSFFSLPVAEQRTVQRTNNNSRGFFADEFTKQTRDWKMGFDFGHVPRPDLPEDHPENWALDGQNQWPAGRPQFKEAMTAYYEAVAGLAAVLMGAVFAALGVDVAEEHLEDAFRPHTGFLRLNYYPPCPEADSTLSVNRHTDAAALTLLLQDDDVVSLQVNHNGTGEWVSIQPVPGAITINVGDTLQVWSNDRYRAPEHRVLAHSDRERSSAPFFFGPGYNVSVRPLESIRGAEPPRYFPYTWGHFRWRRFEGDYADVGREIQITDFLISSQGSSASHSEL